MENWFNKIKKANRFCLIIILIYLLLYSVIWAIYLQFNSFSWSDFLLRLTGVYLFCAGSVFLYLYIPNRRVLLFFFKTLFLQCNPVSIIENVEPVVKQLDKKSGYFFAKERTIIRLKYLLASSYFNVGYIDKALDYYTYVVNYIDYDISNINRLLYYSGIINILLCKNDLEKAKKYLKLYKDILNSRNKVKYFKLFHSILPIFDYIMEHGYNEYVYLIELYERLLADIKDYRLTLFKMQVCWQLAHLYKKKGDSALQIHYLKSIAEQGNTMSICKQSIAMLSTQKIDIPKPIIEEVKVTVRPTVTVVLYLLLTAGLAILVYSFLTLII
ncbi:hypothetical protein [Lachnotalea sp. AF33-28]|uniref:hypothetical protein n=1 Tax=Lachnotalea sp. AF33-28 TaxID=2292046 RepID=UPI000E4DE836|nr:hypothetical protein [Lachnotalea sp. AF33-28]RHP34027.1 hypothetical protein DWZ56_09195 [Lachnotalea sp. AF33-28]